MRSLLFASVAIALAAMAAPSLLTHFLDQSAKAERAVVDEQAMAAGDEGTTLSRDASPDQVAFEAERDGHFYVEAEVNFSPIRLMVDTGATVVALRRSDAEAAGIRLISSDFEYPVATAGGTAYAAEAELDSIAIEGIEVTGVRALVLPDDQLSISLLGGSFLSRLARFEVSDGTLIFEN